MKNSITVNINQQSPDYQQILPEDHEHNPRISLIIHFEPQMKNIDVLQKILAGRANEAEAELLNQYPEKLVKPVIQKLRNVMNGIKNEADQSMAIFVCPVSEKVIYFTYNTYLSEFHKLHPLRTLTSK
ncbi:MAG TPA: hypothetical protein VLI68_12660 [Hanamia sp.]|jgi:hypothetical protein|nr:hypothetical protein [Hanamia sp.]